MRFIETPLRGVWEIDPDLMEDERGFFARSFDAHEWQKRAMNPALAQCNISFNKSAGTLRGLHWQAAPHGEDKLVRVTSGAIWDVAVDLRPDSPTFLKWHAVELSARNRRSFYIPQGLAHGFQTLEDSSEVSYLMSEFFYAACSRGARWDDPAFGIAWPRCEARVISQKDAALPLWGERGKGGQPS